MAYTYNITVHGLTVGPFTFHAMPPSNTTDPLNLVVFGDMGRHGGGMVLYQLDLEAQRARQGGSPIAAFIHVGGG